MANTAPSPIVPGGIVTPVDTPVTVIVSATDPDRDVLFCATSGSSHGSAVLANSAMAFPYSNTITYTPTPGFVGTDTIIFSVNDTFNPPVSASFTVTVTANVQYYDADYTIFLTDTDLCAQEQAAFPDGIFEAPETVARQFGIEFPVSSTPGEGNEIWTYGAGNGTAGLTTAVDSVIIPAGFTIDRFGNLVVDASQTIARVFRWRGFFLRRGVPGPVTKEALQTHRWMNGFEHATSGDGETGGAVVQRKTRHASRVLGGLGLALRNPAAETLTMSQATTGTGFPTKTGWERIYVCLRRYPAALTQIWGIKGSIEAGTAAHLMVDQNGRLFLYNKGNQVYPGTTIPAASGGQLQLNIWAKLDIIYTFKSSAQAGGAILYVNGQETARLIGSNTTTIAGAGGLLNTAQNHSQSSVGNEDATANTLEIDYDDWTNKTLPTLFTGDDWNFGTHIRARRITGFGPGHDASWVGAFHCLDGVPVNGQVESVVSSTAGVSAEVTTDYEDEMQGCSGLAIKLFMLNASGTGEQMGYSTNGGAFTMFNVTTSSATWAVPSPTTLLPQILYSAGGNLEPPTLTSVNVKYTRDGAATVRRVQALQVDAEYIGIWGDEDPPGLQNPGVAAPRQGPHNSPYPDNGFGQTAFAPPNGHVEIMSGTYVGNGTGQDITCKLPAHWIWIRATSGPSTGGSRWWSSCLAGHDPLIETPNKGNLVRAYTTDRDSPTNTSYKFRVSGNNDNSNANGTTYQWVAFSDVTMRYCLNGAYLTAAGTASFTHPLFDPTFTPLAGFLLPELGTAAATTGLYFKGTGSAANGASLMDSAEAATVCAFAQGSITPKTIINLASTQTAYSLWRATDANGNSGAVAITNYTGDGTGARVISLVLGGKSPSFSLVQPNNGVAYARDPGHTGTQSHAINASAAGVSNTAITAVAANQITVGATLNALGVVYSVFALAGSSSNPSDPIPTGDPPIPPPPTGPGTFNGWWVNSDKFAGAADVTTFPPTNPQDARDWQKISAFATGVGLFLGGHPGPGCNVDNFFYYAGNDYALGTAQPTIRVFDGTSDRTLITIPDVAGVKALAIMSMISVGQTIYLTTLDSGTSAADYAGRVFALDPIALTMTQIGTQFTTGEVPYALCWHMGRLFMGTNKSTGAAAKVYWIRPGIDAAWTTDRTLTTDGVGGCCSLASYQGQLYVGCNATAVMGTNKILVRDTAGAYTTAYTAVVTGTFRNGNAFPAMAVFNNKLYASFYNSDSGTSDSLIVRYDGSAWIVAFTGSGATLRPYVALIPVQQDTLLAIGGGNAQTATLLRTVDGATWSNVTANLAFPTGVTALPILGQIGA